MKLLNHCFALALAVTALSTPLWSCGKADSNKNAIPEFVTVDSTGHFRLGDSAYRFTGTNLWYGVILASEGTGGDRRRLTAELDTLHALGLDNLRILVGGDGSTSDNTPFQISPTLQTAPGVYNDTLLRGLDHLLVELEKRDMKAVLYLNNAWEWSGGFGKYLEWAGHGSSPMPNTDGYHKYIGHVRHFSTCDTAKALFYDHIRNIVGRTNSLTGRPYAESSAIMSWQICNEPRAFDRANLDAMVQWIDTASRIIKEIDPNHLVSAGSEGAWGCEGDLDTWVRINTLPSIDYATIHIWPYNWRWVRDSTTVSGIDNAKAQTYDYIIHHVEALHGTGRPIVLEEFGYPRDNMATAVGSPVTARRQYYDYVMSFVSDSLMLDGLNFWGWGGHALPQHENWQPGDPYTGDPAQEAQGLNSVFVSDGFQFGK